MYRIFMSQKIMNKGYRLVYYNIILLMIVYLFLGCQFLVSILQFLLISLRLPYEPTTIEYDKSKFSMPKLETFSFKNFGAQDLRQSKGLSLEIRRVLWQRLKQQRDRNIYTIPFHQYRSAWDSNFQLCLLIQRLYYKNR